MAKEYRRDFHALEVRRRRGMAMLAEGKTQAEVARRCKVTTACTNHWAKLMLAKPHKPWTGRRLGKPSKLTKRHKAFLERVIKTSPLKFGFFTELWTLPRLAGVLKEKTGLKIHPAHLWKVLDALGYSPQKPEKRALQRNESEVVYWKHYRFPALKKRLVGKNE